MAEEEKRDKERDPFRKVSQRMWSDRRVMALSPIPPSGQSLWFLLLTGPQTTNVPGLQPIGRAAFAEQQSWTLEDFDKAFAEVSGQGLAVADWKARLIFVPKAIAHNAPQSPNVVKSWAYTWARVPECDLKAEAWHTLYVALCDMGPAYAEAFKAACSLDFEAPTKPSGKAFEKPSANDSEKPCGNQEQGARAGTGETTRPPAPAPRRKSAGKSDGADDRSLTVADLVAEGVDEQHATDWLKVRKVHRAPLTQTAWDGLKREAEKARTTPAEAVRLAAKKSWRGFEAAWVKPGDVKTSGPAELFSDDATAARDAEALALLGFSSGEVIDA
jgi:hypothetical protein